MGTRAGRRAVITGIAAAAAALTAAVSALGVVGPTTLVSRPSAVSDPGATDIRFVATSRDGSHAFFTTTKRMTADDRDSNRLDIYERFKGKTTLMSGPTGVVDPNSDNVKFTGISEDGTQVFFETTQRLSPNDGDGGKTDVYTHAAQATNLVSIPTDPQNDPKTGTSVFSGVSRDGTHVYFASNEALTDGDHDGGQFDLYERVDNHTNLVSSATKLNEPAGAPGGVDYVGSTYDGKRVFFETFQKLDPEDTDEGKIDVYSHANGLTAIESAPSPGTPIENADDVHFAGASADGNHIYFSTKERMTGDDNDSHWIDIYERFNNDTFLSSAPTGILDPDNDNVTFKGVSEDGNRVYFETKQRLTADDADTGQRDVYERSAGTTKLISKGTLTGQPFKDATFGSASRDGTHVFFSTEERLTSDDREPAGKTLNDVYERAGGTTLLASKAAPGTVAKSAFAANYAGASTSGNRVFFTTNQKLTPDDFDKNRNDIYERAGRTTALVSKPSDRNDPDFLGPSTFAGTSALGSIVYFTTTDPLSTKDKDRKLSDLYSAGSADPGLKPRNVAPRISKVRVSGKRITFRLSEKGTVRFTFSRKRGKHYHGTAGAFSVKAKAGSNKVSFKTRARFAKGSYRIRAVATDKGHKRSKPAFEKFKIR